MKQRAAQCCAARNTLRLETGVAYLAHGGFQENATGGQGTDTAYGYVQMRWRF